MLPAYHVLNAGKFEPNVQDSPRPNFFSYLTEVETSLIMAAFFFFFICKWANARSRLHQETSSYIYFLLGQGNR